MYPEFAETDFIEEFVEDQAFEDHLVGYFSTLSNPDTVLALLLGA